MHRTPKTFARGEERGAPNVGKWKNIPRQALVKPEELEGTADDDRYFNSCFFTLLLLHSFNSCYCPVAGEGVAFKYFNSCWMARWCRREWQESCSSRSDKALLGWWP